MSLTGLTTVEIEDLLWHRVAPSALRLHSRMPRIHCERTTAGPPLDRSRNAVRMMTQRRLADYIGLTVRKLRSDGFHSAGARRRVRSVQELSGDIEKGRKNPTTDVIEAIAEALGVPAENCSIMPLSTRRIPSPARAAQLEDVPKKTRRLESSRIWHGACGLPTGASCSIWRAGSHASIPARPVARR